MARIKSLPLRIQSAPSRTKTVSSTSWRAGKSSAERGYGYRWQQARGEYLRLRPFCVMCLDKLGVSRESATEDVVLACAERGVPVPLASVVDHVVAHRGNQTLFWDESNWQGLCSTHHSRDKQREEARVG